jgi:hypothetical protein
MSARGKKCARLFVFFSIIILILAGCPMYTAVGFKYAEASGGGEDGQIEGEDPVPVEVYGSEVTLAWDTPPSDVETYRVFFRIHDDDTWYELTDPENPDDPLIVAPNPEYTVVHSRVENGVFDFGVTAVSPEEQESSRHTSLDITAQPDTGWFLIWNH